jgi:hypothetical protein
MALPLNEKTVQISVEGQYTKKKFEGLFTMKCKLTMAEKYKLEMEKSRMKSDVRFGTDGFDTIISILAALRVRVIKAPDWWTQSDGGLDLIDDNVVLEVYEKSIDVELEWEKEISATAGVPPQNPT